MNRINFWGTTAAFLHPVTKLTCTVKTLLIYRLAPPVCVPNIFGQEINPKLLSDASLGV